MLVKKVENRKETQYQKINDAQRIMNGRQRQSFERLWTLETVQGPGSNAKLRSINCTKALMYLVYMYCAYTVDK